MALFQWRRFAFFDKELVKDASGQPFDGFKDMEIVCVASGRGQILVGERGGCISCIDRQFENIRTFRAYSYRLTHMHQMRQFNILVTVGEEEANSSSVIKVWNMDKQDRSGSFLCVRVTKVILPTTSATAQSASGTDKQIFTVRCVAVHDNLNWLAVGFASGAVLLYRGDVTRDKNSRARVVHDGAQSINCLAFRAGHLFVVSAADTFALSLVDRNGKERERVERTPLSACGAAQRCAVLADASLEHQLVVAAHEAVYFVAADCVGSCLAFVGEKVRATWHRGYLVLVSREAKLSDPSTTAMGKSKAAGSGMEQSALNETQQTYLVTVYDIQNKFIACSFAFASICEVCSEWGGLYVLTTDGRVYMLREKDTQSKLDILFKKNLYALAITLAKSQKYDADGLVDLFRQYADHLYARGEYDAAMREYVRTIGKLEASYVIRKYLDAQRIHNLTAYLQALHRARLATQDHTTLLLNCYTKLKDATALSEFIESLANYTPAQAASTATTASPFDVEQAIRVIRQAGYHQEALTLAEKHTKHDAYLSIVLEDQRAFRRALSYIETLPFEDARRIMKEYGRMLLTNEPRETTALLKSLCTDYRPRSATKNSPSQRANPDEFVHVFVGNSRSLIDFLECVLLPAFGEEQSSAVGPNARPEGSRPLSNMLIELYLEELDRLAAERNAPDEFERLKRTKDIETKLLTMLRAESQYDSDAALVQCELHRCRSAVLFLYARRKAYRAILDFHADAHDDEAVLETCKSFGKLDSSLWIAALHYFARKTDDEAFRSENDANSGSGTQQRASLSVYIQEVLRNIDENRLVKPLSVIQVLASSKSVTVGASRAYIERHLKALGSQIEEDERAIELQRTETARLRAAMVDLRTRPQVFQPSKCAICNHGLELPTVHFLCTHSFHQPCFESYTVDENECPVCAPANRKTYEALQRTQADAIGLDADAYASMYDAFVKQMATATDRFQVLADYFGKGFFTKQSTLTTGGSLTLPKSQPDVASNRAGAMGRQGQGHVKTQSASGAIRQSAPIAAARGVGGARASPVPVEAAVAAGSFGAPTLSDRIPASSSFDRDRQNASSASLASNARATATNRPRPASTQVTVPAPAATSKKPAANPFDEPSTGGGNPFEVDMREEQRRTVRVENPARQAPVASSYKAPSAVQKPKASNPFLD